MPLTLQPPEVVPAGNRKAAQSGSNLALAGLQREHKTV